VKSTITVTPDLSVHAEDDAALTDGADAAIATDAIATDAIAAPITGATNVRTRVLIVS